MAMEHLPFIDAFPTETYIHAWVCPQNRHSCGWCSHVFFHSNLHFVGGFSHGKLLKPWSAWSDLGRSGRGPRRGLELSTYVHIEVAMSTGESIHQYVGGVSTNGGSPGDHPNGLMGLSFNMYIHGWKYPLFWNMWIESWYGYSEC